MASVLTIHAMDPALSRRISSRARREGKSLNQTVKDALAESFGLKPGSSHTVADNGIMSLCGILPHDAADELRAAVAPFREVHPTHPSTGISNRRERSYRSATSG